jgi:hypothetical protein
MGSKRLPQGQAGEPSIVLSRDYLNICIYSLITKPAISTTENGQKEGQDWTVPCFKLILWSEERIHKAQWEPIAKSEDDSIFA